MVELAIVGAAVSYLKNNIMNNRTEEGFTGSNLSVNKTSIIISIIFVILFLILSWYLFIVSILGSINCIRKNKKWSMFQKSCDLIGSFSHPLIKIIGSWLSKNKCWMGDLAYFVVFLIVMDVVSILYMSNFTNYNNVESFCTGAQNISGGRKLVAYLVPWCGYCNNLKKKLQHNTSTNQFDKIKVPHEIITDEKIHKEQKIRGFPTIRLVEDGKVIKEYSGNRSAESLHDFFHGK